MGRTIRRASLAALLLIAFAASLAVGPASADPFPVARVSLYGCAVLGDRYVLSGTELNLVINWEAANTGLVQVGINGTTLHVAVNGAPITNTASYWGSITPVPDPTFPQLANSEWTYPIAPLPSGATFTLSATWTFTHPLIDRVIFNPNGSPFLYSGMYFSGSCTVHVV